VVPLGSGVTTFRIPDRPWFLNRRHQRISEKHRQADAEAELRPCLAVRADPRRIVVGGSCNQAGPKPAKKTFVLFGGLFLLRHSRFVSDPAYERQKGKSGSASHVL
jgi:hypothetical protein